MPETALFRLGFMRGDKSCWCAGCNREFKGGMIARGRKVVLAWNCQPCAQKAARGVENDLGEAGYEE